MRHRCKRKLKEKNCSGCQNFECQDLFSLSKRLSEAAIKFSLSGRNCRGKTEYITMSNLRRDGGVRSSELENLRNGLCILDPH